MKKDEIIIFIVSLVLMILIPIIYKSYQCTYWGVECSEVWNTVSKGITEWLFRMIAAIL